MRSCALKPTDNAFHKKTVSEYLDWKIRDNLYVYVYWEENKKNEKKSESSEHASLVWNAVWNGMAVGKEADLSIPSDTDINIHTLHLLLKRSSELQSHCK